MAQVFVGYKKIIRAMLENEVKIKWFGTTVAKRFRIEKLTDLHICYTRAHQKYKYLSYIYSGLVLRLVLRMKIPYCDINSEMALKYKQQHYWWS